MNKINKYYKKNILVLGMGKSGLAAAKLLKILGADVLVNDNKLYPENHEDMIFLQKLSIKTITGYHPDDLINNNIDLIIKNPGIPYHITPIRKAIDLGIPVITEIELAYDFIKTDIISITGSNGKTTTTSLVGQIFAHAGNNSKVGGNIGLPLSDIAYDIITNNLSYDNLILELSSFQLQGIKNYNSHIAAIINIYETHLDYHKNMDDYIRAKSKITVNQNKDDFLILNSDQEISSYFRSKSRANILMCSLKSNNINGIVVDGDEIISRTEMSKTPLFALEDIKLPGEHNIENVLFATAISVIKGIPSNVIRDSVRTFPGVEHRIEFVIEINKIKYYNDSKATNQEATIKALQSFTDNIVLIAGGLDRGNDFDLLSRYMRNKVKKLLVYGQTAEKIKEAGQKANIDNIKICDDLKDATRRAKNLAIAGDIVLLSPACASWDSFASFEERGKLFKKYVCEENID